MSFQDMMTDTVKILKSDGTEIDGIKASVQSGSIFILDSSILIEPNDLVIRNMSNGGAETFKVLDPGFQEKFHGIEAHYNIKVNKLGLPEAEKAIQSITYNLNGPNARINNNSVDNSTNISMTNPEISEHISMLRDEVSRLVTEQSTRAESNEIIDAIEAQFQKEKPSKSVVTTLLAGLPAAGSIASIGSFLLSAITG